MGKKIEERVAVPFRESRVDREAGTIDGVLICGFESANKRRYPASVLKAHLAKYEGKPVNTDHSNDATVDRRFGWFTDVRIGDDGKPRGKLNCLKSHPMYERVMEAAERNPAMFGFSHVAYCQTKTERDGTETVESIDDVVSIDLVAEPATAKSLFESVSHKSKTKGNSSMLTFKQLVESLVKHSATTTKQVLAVKRLREMDGMDGVMDAPTGLDSAPADDADPGDGVTEAFKTAAISILTQIIHGEMDMDEGFSKLRKIVKSHDQIKGDSSAIDTGDSDSTDSADDGAEDTEDDVKESRNRVDPFLLLEEIQAECGDNFKPGKSLLQALSMLPNAADRRALLAEMRGATVKKEQVTSGRPTTANATKEAKEVPTGEAFIKALKS